MNGLVVGKDDGHLVFSRTCSSGRESALTIGISEPTYFGCYKVTMRHPLDGLILADDLPRGSRGGKGEIVGRDVALVVVAFGGAFADVGV